MQLDFIYFLVYQEMLIVLTKERKNCSFGRYFWIFNKAPLYIEMNALSKFGEYILQ